MFLLDVFSPLGNLSEISRIENEKKDTKKWNGLDELH